MKTDILAMEKNAIFEASLKLLKAGKFQGTPLAEIAFLSKMSSRLIENIFNTRENLLCEMSAMLTSRIIRVIADAGEKSRSFKESFFQVWTALYKYYTRNPDVIAFMEQFETIKVSQKEPRVIHPGNSTPLIQLFTHPDCPLENRETLAAIFHSNVLSAAKMSSASDFNDLKLQPEFFSQLLWNGLCCSETKSQ
ncbi:MAG: hypothetical protein WD824_21670 [Cyclobacteriaceae bacterium]